MEGFASLLKEIHSFRRKNDLTHDELAEQLMDIYHFQKWYSKCKNELTEKDKEVIDEIVKNADKTSV